MAKINFTTKGKGRAGKVALRVYHNGKADCMTVQGLINPNMSAWDEDKQQFIEPTKEAITNNQILADLMAMALKIVSSNNLPTASDYIKTIRNCGITPYEMTLGEFVQRIIDEERRNPTNNFQLYLSLLNNLKGQNCRCRHLGNTVTYFEKAAYRGVALVDTPISEVSNSHLAEFADWVKRVKNGASYKNLNASLKRVVNAARERGLNNNKITFSAKKCADKTIKSKITVLSINQLLNLKRLSATQEKDALGRLIKNHQLYVDTAMLMYYTFSRPADVMRFRSDMIEERNGQKVLVYTPHKMRTSDVVRRVELPLCNEALAIIDKYKGKSKGGFILPYDFNDEVFDISTVDGFRQWEIKNKKRLNTVNSHLKRLANKIGIDFDITLYDLRHSSISHAIESGASSALVARYAGTSSAMIDRHYLQPTDLRPLALPA